MHKYAKYFLWTIAFLLSCSLFSAELNVTVSPENATVGTTVELCLSSDKDYPSIIQLPQVDGITWNKGERKSMQTRIINLKKEVSAQTIYSFKVTKEGKINIPPMKVQLADKKVVTEPVELQVTANRFTASDSKGNSKNVELKDMVYCKAALLTEKKDFYVGEEIPVEIRLYKINGLNAVFDYPNIEAENVIFRDYSKENRENNKFAAVRKIAERVNGQLFDIFSFRADLTPISQGKINIKIKEDCVIRVPNKNNERRRSSPFDDDFFESFMGVANYQEIAHPVSTEIKDIEVKPLPELTGSSIFLGLLGNWKTKLQLSSEKAKTGEPLTLSIEITGQGAPENLKVPQLSIPDFRVYPPETEKTQLAAASNHKIILKYVLIPLKEGNAEINLDFSTFNVSEKRYDTVLFNKKLSIAKGEVAAASLDKQVFLDSAKQEVLTHTEKSEKTEKARSSILYLKRCVSEGICIPLWKNNLLLVFVLLFFPPLIWGIWELVLYRRNKLHSDPEYKRKVSAAAFKNVLLKRIKNANDEELDNVLMTDLLKYLIDMHLMPLGTTPSELAAKVRDADISECLKHMGSNAYMPGAVRIDKKELRERVYNAVKKYTVILTLFLIPFTGYSVSADSKAAKHNSESALTFYDEGKFDKAMEYYKSIYNPQQPGPKVLYNIANCLCQKGELSKALAYYEKAHRLTPRDSDIVENMNFVKRKLGLPESCTIANPRELVRYICFMLRPDQWLLLACAGWALISVALILRHYIKGSKWIALVFMGCFIIVISTCIAIFEDNTEYNADKAIIIVRHPVVYSLPSEKSNTADARLTAGDEVNIEEVRTDWTRIRSATVSGWIKSSDVSRLWGDWKRLP